MKKECSTVHEQGFMTLAEGLEKHASNKDIHEQAYVAKSRNDTLGTCL